MKTILKRVAALFDTRTLWLVLLALLVGNLMGHRAAQTALAGCLTAPDAESAQMACEGWMAAP